ncbi:hypothetical protein HPB48_000850 [Haemaphysalis longicornis]|uniref:Uncharacterized protein n=1 Tax=Haemaphysalis longicornis TaxID=44386 RepID=A0A9J6FU03_HAELO|nr:hypothetical protein HPB48_000850 [Haemaphysalis longicornis]
MQIDHMDDTTIYWTTATRPPSSHDPTNLINGQPITEVQTLDILEVPYHHDGQIAALLPTLQKAVSQLTHLTKRICTSRSGIRESDTFQHIQAMLISRVLTVARLVSLNTQESNKFDIMR